MTDRDDDKGEATEGPGEETHTDAAGVPYGKKSEPPSGKDAAGEAYEKKADDKKPEEREARGSEPSEEHGDHYETAKDELFEAVHHFSSAAAILLGRMTRDLGDQAKDIAKDPVVKDAKKAVKRLGKEAEPLVRDVTGALRDLSKKLMEAAAPKGKSESPPPRRDGDDE